MRARLLLAALAALLTGCQTSYIGNVNSPFYVVPAGSQLTLNREIRIPAEQLGVYIQDGRVLRNAEVQHYYPFCKFDLYQLSPAERAVAPDRIAVVKAVQEETQGALTQAAPLLVAGAFLRLRAELGGGPPPVQSFSTRMHLRAEKQPDIFRLTCAQWGYPGADRHVTIAEIWRTLDNLFTLQLPSE